MKYLINILMVLLVSMSIQAKDIKRPQTHNYQKALEAYEERDYNNALLYLQAELDENKKNGYAWAYMGRIFAIKSEAADALDASEQATKYLPKKDGDYRSWNFQTIGLAHLQLGDSLQAFNDYSMAIKANEKDPSYYFPYASLAVDLNKIDAAEKSIKNLLKIAPNNSKGLTYLGWIYAIQDRNEEALSCFDRAIKLDPQNSKAYAIRSVLYHKEGKDRQAVDDFISSVRIDVDEDYATDTFLKIMKSNPSLVTSKLKVEALRDNRAVWSYYLGYGYYSIGDYDNAIEWFNKCSQLVSSSTIDYYLALCYAGTNENYNALNHVQKAIEQNNDNYKYYVLSSEIKRRLSRLDEALDDVTTAIGMNPDAASYYEGRANIYMERQEWEKAADDYGMSIALYPYDIDTYVNRGIASYYSGKKQDAENDFKSALQMERDSLYIWYPTKLFYAHHFLGDDIGAKRAFNAMVNDSTDNQTYYDGACLYALMGEKGEAINYLRQALDGGYVDFAHLENDKNLDNIRTLSAFKTLTKQYQDKFIESKSNDNSLWKLVTTEIPFIRENGVCKVKCSINDLPLSFVFDTGAADVTISNVEATFMLKNGYLKKEDIGGNQTYLNASGEISVGTIINLRSVVVGEVELKNVKASVTDSNSAPLLLGQTVFRQIGNIEIDNANKVLRLSYRKPSK